MKPEDGVAGECIEKSLPLLDPLPSPWHASLQARWRVPEFFREVACAIHFAL
jgi:hypothetical protein